MRRKDFSMTAARYLLRAGAAGVVAGLALLGLPGGTALAATAVSNATLQVSSLSASATDVSYSVTFATPAALTSGTSTITLTAPTGTVLPAAGSVCYSVADDQGGGAFDTSGCGSVTVTGTTAVITVPLTIAAGDSVTVLVPGVSNPATTGTKHLKVSTSADTTQVSLSYKLAAKRSVTDAALHVSSASAGASGVTYGVTFLSPDRLTKTSQVTIKFPAGTVLPATGGCSVVGMTDDTDGSGGCVAYSASGTTATITPVLTNPGDVSTITIAGVTNSSAAGTKNVTLSTTADPKAVTLSYSLKAKRAVTNKFLQLSSYTAGASNVTWSVGFTAPDRLIDSGSTTSSSTVTIKAPAGTVFPSGGCSVYYFIDASPAASQGPENGCAAATVTGTTVSVTAAFDTNPGDTVFVVIKGVTNPATMSTVSVSTSADPKAVSLPLTGPTAMTANGQLSSTSAGATKVAYTATFATTGALTSDASTLTLDSAGATFPLCSASGQYLFIDDTTGYETGLCPVSGSSAGPSITLSYTGTTTKARDEITIIADGVANAATSGSKTLSVTTAPGAGSASLPFTLTAQTPVSSRIFSLVSTSASATGVAYAVTFTVANGFTVNGAGDDFSAFTLKAPSGTSFPAGGYAETFNDNTGSGGAGSYTASGTTATVLPPSGGNFGGGPGDEISVIIFGVANPSASGAQTGSLSTTSDPAAVSLGYTLTPQTSVSHDILQLSSRTGGAANVTYSFTFRATNGLMSATYSGSAITVTLPTGTVMPPNGSGDVSVVDDTTSQACGGSLASSGTTGTVTISTGSCPQELAAGDVVTLVLTGVTNAHSLSGAKVHLATSSDPATVTTAVP
jgi:hypothetical protein